MPRHPHPDPVRLERDPHIVPVRGIDRYPHVVSVRLDDESFAELTARCERLGISRTQLLLRAIAAYHPGEINYPATVSANITGRTMEPALTP